MTNALLSRGEDDPAPINLTLPPAANGYRRSLWRGRGLAVYCDRHPPNEWRTHKHEQLQIAVVLDPVKFELRWQTGNSRERRQNLTGPVVFIVPALMPHTLIWPEQGDMVTLFFARHLVREILNQDVTRQAFFELPLLGWRDRVITQLAEAFRPLCEREGQPNSHYVAAIGNVLGTHILQAMFGAELTPDRQGGLPAESIQRVESYIAKNLELGYDSAALARVAGFSRNHFTVLFEKSFGKTPRRYFRECQVFAAADLLLTTDKKVIEIAESLGFSTPGMMVKWFHLVLGRSPSDVRRRGRES